ncbi:hypothetical protein BOX15_Mlig020514g1 [Macrostomum lignano]|uniref:TM7S3/TM198-like domain-containing protein n=1 Tax=Macrostomum lignano TaxID=282301 RepID=A0A267FYN4_9PLAT|nr:hypothetical protein BOX15_Mlig020514g1 [Macrostomum lignano]
MLELYASSSVSLRPGVLLLLMPLCFSFSLVVPQALAAEYHWNQLEPVSISSATSPPGVVALATPSGGAPSDTAFLQLQAHLPPDQPSDSRISLSTRPDFHPLYTSSGHQTGLISLNVSIAYWYIRADNASSGPPSNITAWILFIAKAWDEPLPGGCDLTSPVANPPGLVSKPAILSGIAWQLGYALAGSFDTVKRSRESCNLSLQRGNLRYRLYAMALNSGKLTDWLAGLKRMATAQQATVYGQQLAMDGGNGKRPTGSKFDVGARPGMPVLYTVVVERTDTGQFSAYVPVTLDACQSHGFPPECVAASAIEWRVATFAAALLGLYFCTMGFRFFAFSVLIAGFAAGSLFTLPGTLRALSLSSESTWLAYLLGAGVGGLALGLIGWALWLRCKSTVLGLLFVHLPCSYLLACAAFATPLGQLWWLMREEYIMFLSVAVVAMLCLLLLLLFSNAGAIFAMSLLGIFTLAVGIAANLLEGSAFPYIFLDLFRRTAYKDYNRVHMFMSLRHTVDWALLLACLAALPLCCLLQYCWNRRCLDPATRGRQAQRRMTAGNSDADTFGYTGLANERTPLLAQASAPPPLSALGASSGRRSPPPVYAT